MDVQNHLPPYDVSDWAEEELEALAAQMFDQLDDPEPIR
jgi:hypothetical protein